jgi:predicted amidophosphoribosyltransferase
MKGESPVSLMLSSRVYPGITELHHVAFYHAPRMGYQDVVSRTVLEFKSGCEPQTTRWINLVVPPATRKLKFDLIVRALGHQETVSAGTMPMDRLCTALARDTGKPFDQHRLTKDHTVQPLATLGGRNAREAELAGTYHFDPEGIPENNRILIVDDFAATGVTLKMIASAIKESREDLQVACLVLARADAEQRNSHLDPEYFIRSSAAAPVASAPTRPARVKSMRDTRPPRMMSVRHTGAEKQLMRIVEGTPSPKAGPSRIAQNSRPAARRGIPVWVYVAGLSCSLILLGATVLMPKSKGTADPPPQFVQLVEASGVISPDPIPERQVDPFPSSADGKPGMITVPSTGLRVGHSMGAKPIPRVRLKNREKVLILRRVTSDFGPDWIQIRSRSGTTGWVVASVVREIRG